MRTSERAILLRKSLRSGDVRREGEIAIAHHEGGGLVDGGDGGIVARYQRLPVDGLGRVRAHAC